MALGKRYNSTYNDITGVEHQIDIYIEGYVGSVDSIDGTAVLTYPDVDKPLEPIRGSGLSVTLEASSTRDYSDLYKVAERSVKVVYLRSGTTLFEGWLNPEGWFESYVTDVWMVTFDCVDGLSYLEGLAYVQTDGTPFTGKQTPIEIVSNCLARAGLDSNILTDVGVRWTGLAGSSDPMANTYFNTERFIKDDGETYMNCLEVLRTTLEVFTACIAQVEGEWLVWRPAQLAASSSMTFFKYDSSGSYIELDNKTLDETIYSEVDGQTHFHVNQNQQITNRNSLGAIRVNYKYGKAKGLIANKFLYYSGGAYTGWAITSATNTTLPSDPGYGITWNVVGVGAGIAQFTSTGPTTIAADDIVYVGFKVRQSVYPFTIAGTFRVQVTLVVGATTYYLYPDGSWSTTNRFLTKSFTGLITDVAEWTSQGAPGAGNLTVQIWTPENSSGGPAGTMQLLEQVVENRNENLGEIEGEFHTVERTSSPSSKIDDPTEVFVGDNYEDTYEGAIYQNDQVTNTNEWTRDAVAETKPILQIMGEEHLRLQQEVSRVFMGDVYQYFSYLQQISIDQFSGVYMVQGWSYDTMMNTITCKFREVFTDEIGDATYEKTTDYGNTVKPTIQSGVA